MVSMVPAFLGLGELPRQMRYKWMSFGPTAELGIVESPCEKTNWFGEWSSIWHRLQTQISQARYETQISMTLHKISRDRNLHSISYSKHVFPLTAVHYAFLILPTYLFKKRLRFFFSPLPQPKNPGWKLFHWNLKGTPWMPISRQEIMPFFRDSEPPSSRFRMSHWKKEGWHWGMYPLDSHDCFLWNPASQGFLSSLNLESGALGGKLRFKERVQDRLTGRPVHQSVCSCKGVGGKGIPSNELVDVCI